MYQALGLNPIHRRVFFKLLNPVEGLWPPTLEFLIYWVWWRVLEIYIFNKFPGEMAATGPGAIL